jgi:hypothetical protein
MLIVERLYTSVRNSKFLSERKAILRPFLTMITMENKTLSQIMLLMSYFIPTLFKIDTFLMKVLANVQLVLKYSDSPVHGIFK